MPSDPMLVLLKASAQIRDGAWIRGNPTHVLAEFLSAIEAQGFELRPMRDFDPSSAQGFLEELGDRAGVGNCSEFFDPPWWMGLAALLNEGWEIYPPDSERSPAQRTAGRLRVSIEERVLNVLRNGLKAISTAGQGAPFEEEYREAGGGYEGLQAIAERALEIADEWLRR